MIKDSMPFTINFRFQSSFDDAIIGKTNFFQMINKAFCDVGNPISAKLFLSQTNEFNNLSSLTITLKGIPVPLLLTEAGMTKILQGRKFAPTIDHFNALSFNLHLYRTMAIVSYWLGTIAKWESSNL